MDNVPSATRWQARYRVLPTSYASFMSLGEAAKPIATADLHAKKELKKHVRGVRPLERALEGRIDARFRGSARLLPGSQERAH